MPQLKHRNQTEGSSVVLLCTAQEGSRPLSFEWARSGQTIHPNSNPNYKIENSEIFSTFTIPTISRRDSANYSCLVRNNFGSDSQYSLLSVNGI